MTAAARLLAERGVTLLSLDLDDTLLDTDGVAALRLEAAAARIHELDPGIDHAALEAAIAAGMLVDPIAEGRIPAFVGALGVAPESSLGVAARERYNAVLIEMLAWIEGVEPILARLRERYRLAIVTNGPAEFQWSKLRKFGLQDLVDHVIVSGDYGVRKPDPALFGHLLAAAGVAAPRAAHVGDSLHTDVAGARAAGLTAIWYPPQHRERDAAGGHDPDAIIDSLADLLADEG